MTGSGFYDQGSKVTLTATPKEGYVFSHWQGDAVGVSNQVTVAMDLARNVEAVFIPETAAGRAWREAVAPWRGDWHVAAAWRRTRPPRHRRAIWWLKIAMGGYTDL